jgi:DNA-binding transcriptional LysR family regulator
MDRLAELEIFCSIAETGSLTRAAQRIGASAPTVSRALADLEERVGIRLIERNTRRLALTQAGQDLVERAATILANYHAAINDLGGAPLHGLLRVTAPLQFGRRHVAPAVLQFLDLYPHIKIELVLNDRNIDLIDEHLDVAVRIGTLPDSGLVARKVGEVRRILVASPAYLKAHGVPNTPLDLARHETIFGVLYDGRHEWQFGPDGSSLIEIEPRLLVNDIEGVLLAARNGRGIARVLSYQALDDLEDGRLVRILAAYEPPPSPVHVVTPSARHMAAKQRTFVDHLVQTLRNDARLRAASVLIGFDAAWKRV